MSGFPSSVPHVPCQACCPSQRAPQPGQLLLQVYYLPAPHFSVLDAVCLSFPTCKMVIIAPQSQGTGNKNGFEQKHRNSEAAGST